MRDRADPDGDTMLSATTSGRRRAPGRERRLPHALIATTLVVVLPALAVWAIVPRGGLVVLALSVPFGMLLSVAAAGLGGAIWKRTPGSSDVVFADLMLWGWLRRVRAERRLARAETLLGGDRHGRSVEVLTELSVLLEARDRYTYGHSQRVTRHAERIAAAMGLSAAEIAKVRTAAALHDVGKLHTPREILNKAGSLTDAEFAVIRRHPGEGAAMAGAVGDPMIIAMIRHHHERLDGAGYPGGLVGEEIPLGARIIAVADTFDAMTSNRAYRRAVGHKRALDVLRSEAGTQFDEGAVAGFLSYYRGRRTVTWSAFAVAVPERLVAWLGSLAPGIGAGAAGATALAIGLGAPPHAPVSTSPTAASTRPSPPLRAEPTPVRDRGRAAGTRSAPRAAHTAGGTAPAANERHAQRRRARSVPDTAAPGRTRSVALRQPQAGDTPGATGAPERTRVRGPGPTRSHPAHPTKPSGGPVHQTPTPQPQVQLPEIKLPPVHVPSLPVPDVALPDLELPNVTPPKVALPGLRGRGATGSRAAQKVLGRTKM
jgi:putative nucleotidyltransferase with HDIG domain